MFAINPAFSAGAEPLFSLALSEVWLQRDARYPWLILIPRVPGAVELEDLPSKARARLVEEIVLAGVAVRAVGEAFGRSVAKLNVGALGNVTPQLHVHVVGRHIDDAVWPDPVWGNGPAIPYEPKALEAARAAARAVLTRARPSAEAGSTRAS
jgi:diadenosine tetraphosphate (Ap4A) HIT family hydrolase